MGVSMVIEVAVGALVFVDVVVLVWWSCSVV